MTGRSRKSGSPARSGIAGNVAINIVGQAAPALAVLVAIPVLVRLLGQDGYGFLALLIVIVGYVGIFDLGLGKAATNLIAAARGTEKDFESVGVAVSALILELVVGLFLAGVLCAVTPWLVGHVLRPPEGGREGMERALWVLSAAAPALTLISGLRGVLAAHSRFDLLNYGRAPITVLIYGGAAAVAAAGGGREELALVLVGVQYVALIQNAWFVARVTPGIFREVFRLTGRWFRLDLIRYGVWLMTSDAAGPIMVYADRFMIAGGLSVAAVGLYSAPYAGVTKLSIVPVSISAILFAELSGFKTRHTSEETNRLVTRSAKYLSVFFLPLVVFLAIYGNTLLRIWLGESFSEKANHLIAVLAVGVFFNAMAHIPYVALRALGRPRATAAVHIAEIPIYVIALWLVIPKFGLIGVATIWSIRMALECIIFYAQANRLLLLKIPRNLIKEMLIVFVVNFAIYLIVRNLSDIGLNIYQGISCAALVFAVGVWIEWMSAFSSSERDMLRSFVRRLFIGRKLG